MTAADPRDAVDKPQPNTVHAEPATAESCQADYADRHHTTNPHPSSFDAQPHTYRR